MSVDTKHVKDRRKLRFESFGDAIRDAEALADAERHGSLRATGNWTLGQAIGHVATWARFPLDGYPPMPRPSWLLRLFIPALKGPFLNKGLPAGANIGNLPTGTLGTEVMETGRAIDNLREAFGRLERMASHPEPVSGQALAQRLDQAESTPRRIAFQLLPSDVTMRWLWEIVTAMSGEATYTCGSCGEEIVIPIDLSQGNSQEYVEDCPVCCRANVIRVEVDADGEVSAWAELE